MPRDDLMTMAKHSRRVCCALAALVAVLLASGCGWKGEGKDVAAALVATKAVKSRAFVGSLKFDVPAGGLAKFAGDSDSAPMLMTFSGASDSSDPAHPKMAIKMTAEGDSTAIVAPGDGKVYVTASGRSWYTEVPPQQAASQAIDPNKIYAALGDAIGNFKQAPPMTNAKGVAVTTVSGTISREKLCGEVIDAFGDTLGRAASGGDRLGGSGVGAQGSAAGAKMFRGLCKTMIKKDPRVWFGIDGGRLTDVELTAKLSVPLAGEMSIEVQYHEYDQDKPQGGFDPPAGARPLSEISPQAFSSGATTALPGIGLD